MILFFFFLYQLIYIVLVCSDSVDTNNDRPKALIHIGPSKTGSTTIQGALNHVRRELESKGWFPIAQSPKHSITHSKTDIDDAFRNFKTQNPEKNTFFRDSLASKQNIIVSGEYLGGKDEEDLELYAEVLSHFDTTVVMYYRDFISRELSYHYQVERYDSFIEFLVSEDMAKMPVNVGAEGYFKRVPMWEKLGSNVDGSSSGKKNRVVIVDFNGAVATGKSFADVFFCDATGILCDEPKLAFNVHSNPSHQKTHGHRVVKRMFLAYAHARGCSVKDHEFDVEVPRIAYSSENEIVAAVQSMNLKQKPAHEKFHEDVMPPDSIVPIRRLDLAHLVRYSNLLDAEMRRLFGDMMVHPNVTANAAAAASHATLEEVDVYKVASSPFWQARFEEEMQLQVRRNAAEGKGTIECLEHTVVAADGTSVPRKSASGTRNAVSGHRSNFRG